MCTEAPGPSSAPGSANASTCRTSRETCADVGAGAAATAGASGAEGGVGGAGAIDVGLGVAVGAGWSADGGGAAAALLDASAWCGAPAAPSDRGIAASISHSVALNPSVMARPTTRKPPRAASAPIRSGAVITSRTMWSSLPTNGYADLCIDAPPSDAHGTPAQRPVDLARARGTSAYGTAPGCRTAPFKAIAIARPAAGPSYSRLLRCMEGSAEGRAAPFPKSDSDHSRSGDSPTTTVRVSAREHTMGPRIPIGPKSCPKNSGAIIWRTRGRLSETRSPIAHGRGPENA